MPLTPAARRIVLKLAGRGLFAPPGGGGGGSGSGSGAMQQRRAATEGA
jgi:hypothetical protein